MKKLSDLTPAPYNPRTLSEDAANGLQTSLSQFGDIAGIVYNKRTGNLVCGHQRINELRKIYGDLAIKKDIIITPNGDTFKVRTVDWPLEREKAANIAANNPHVAGEFDDDALSALLKEILVDDIELFNELQFEKLQFEKLLEPVIANNDPDAEWTGMPDYEHEDILGSYYAKIIFRFSNEEDLQKFAGLIGQKLTNKTRAAYYPEEEQSDRRNYMYTDES